MATGGELITVNAPGASGLQYDSTTSAWQFNWKTSGLAPGCYTITIVSAQAGQTSGPFPIRFR